MKYILYNFKFELERPWQETSWNSVNKQRKLYVRNWWEVYIDFKKYKILYESIRVVTENKLFVITDIDITINLTKVLYCSHSKAQVYRVRSECIENISTEFEVLVQ